MTSSPISRARFACLLISSAAFVLPGAAHAADVSISQAANGSTLTVTGSGARFAGAISSLTFRNVQYVNIADHGREIQSAFQLDGFGECLNPTEAGTKADGTSQTSSSVLTSISNSGNTLTTVNRPAYWLAPGENYGKACGSTTATTAQNQTVLSNYTISRTTSFYPSIPNLITADTTFTIPENRSSVGFEALTGYLPSTFNSWLKYDRASRTLVKLTGNSTDQETTSPVIVSQSNGQHAMGVISPGITGADPSHAYYAYFTFGGTTPTSKWSCVYSPGAVTAGTQLTYTCLMAVGTVDEVISALNAYPMPGQTLSSMVPIYRFYKYPQHFMTTSYTEAAGAGFTFETTGFHLFPSGGAGYQPLYRCYNPWSHDHFVSTQSTCEGFNQEGTLGYAATQSAPNLVPLYRFFRSNTSDHLITVNYSEGSGYAYEGTLGYVTY